MSSTTSRPLALPGTDKRAIADVLLHWLAHWLDGPYPENERALTALARGNTNIEARMFDNEVVALTQHANHALSDLVGRLRTLGLDYDDEAGLTPTQILAKRKLMHVSNPRVPAVLFNLVQEFVTDLRNFGPQPNFRPTQTCVTVLKVVRALLRPVA